MLWMKTLLMLLATKGSWRNPPIGHLSVSKMVWKDVIKPGDIVIDATCGNGHDALELAQLTLTDNLGVLHCIDVQDTAIQATKSRLSQELSLGQFERVHFHHQSHESFPPSILPHSVSLVCYNLGYLPGIDRSQSSSILITKKDSSLSSLQAASDLLKPGGLLSVTAYPGHEGGDEETAAIQAYFKNFESNAWRVYEYSPLNRPKSPHLLLAWKLPEKK